jgi:hypothetical protein
VDYAICAEDVDSDQPAVEVDGWALECDANGQALLVAKVMLGFEERRDSVAVEHAAGWIEIVRDMVFENTFQDLLGRLLTMLGDLLESLISGGKDGVVRLGAIEELD